MHLKRSAAKALKCFAKTIKKTAFKITRVGQLVAQEASKRLGVPFGIDLSLAPTPAIGDSVADILEEIESTESRLRRVQLRHLPCQLTR